MSALNLVSNSAVGPDLYQVWQGQGIPQESRCHQIIKRMLQLGTPALGFCARYPAINVSRKFGGANQAYGWILAVVNVITYGSLVGWSFLKMINEEVRILSPAEKALFSRGVKLSMVTKMALVILGLISQLPFSYMAYQYNNNSIFLAILILLADSGPPIYSLNLSAISSYELSREKKLKIDNPHIVNIKSQFISFLEDQRKKLLVMYRTIHDVNGSLTSSLLIQDKVTLIKKAPSEIPLAARIVTHGAGYIVTFGRLAIFSVLTYEAIAQTLASQNNILQISIAAFLALLVFGSNAYLIKDVVIKSALSSLQELKDRIKKEYQQGIGEALRPKLHMSLRLTTLALTALSYSTPIQVAKDHLQNNRIFGLTIPGIELFVEITSTMTVLLLVSNSMRYFTDELIASYILKNGSNQEKALVIVDKKLVSFIHMVKHSHPEDIIAFFKHLNSFVLKNHAINSDGLEDKQNTVATQSFNETELFVIESMKRVEENFSQWIQDHDTSFLNTQLHHAQEV